MKVLYIYYSFSSKGSSVQSKILNQIDFLNKIGVICNGIFFSSQIEKTTQLSDNVNLVPFEKTSRKFFPNLRNRNNLDAALSDYLKINADKYDVLYLRYPLASKGLLKIAKKYGNKIIIEHQSKEIPEIQSLIRNEKFRFKLGYFLYLYEHSFLRVFREKYIGKKILKYVLGGIAVTSEIAEYEMARAKGYRCEVVGNGINFEDFKQNPSAEFDGKNVNLFVLIGANTSSPTHGVDRLIESLKNNNSRLFFNLSVFSKNKYEDAKGNNFSIKYEGYFSREQLDEKLKEMHFAIGGLASFRKEILYGSALKIREYFARGFPVIMASLDEDIENKDEAKQYVVIVSNSNELIDFAIIENKIIDILNVNNRSKLIREIGEQIFSFEVKMKQLAEKMQQMKKIKYGN